MTKPPKITQEEAFEAWLGLRNRSLLTLKLRLNRDPEVKMTMGLLRKWSDLHQWPERAMAIEARVEEEVNAQAMIEVKPGMVRRRGVSIVALGTMYDELLMHAAELVKSQAYKASLEKNPTTDELNKILKAIGTLGDIQESLAPTYVRGETESTDPEISDGPIDPFTLLIQLQNLVKRPKLKELRAAANVIDGKVSEAGPSNPPLRNIGNADSVGRRSIHE